MVSCGRTTYEPFDWSSEPRPDQLSWRVPASKQTIVGPATLTVEEEASHDLEPTKSVVPQRQPRKPKHSVIFNSSQFTGNQVAFPFSKYPYKETKRRSLGNGEERSRVKHKNLSNRNYVIFANFQDNQSRKSGCEHGFTNRFNITQSITSQNQSNLKSSTQITKRRKESARIRQCAYSPSTNLKKAGSKKTSFQEENYSSSPMSCAKVVITLYPNCTL